MKMFVLLGEKERQLGHISSLQQGLRSVFGRETEITIDESVDTTKVQIEADTPKLEVEMRSLFWKELERWERKWK